MNLFIIVLTTACLVLTALLLFIVWKHQQPTENNEVHGPAIDGIEEYDNPLPGWWTLMFVGMFIFAIAYFVLYPGFGKGLLGWTSKNQLAAEEQLAAQTYGPIFEQFRNMPLEDIARHPDGYKMGQRLYANNCAVCHGEAGTGGDGFPNLTDNDWLYGGDPDTILATITNGRKGAMPAWGAVLGNDGMKQVTEYVRSLSNQPDVDVALASQGQPLFAANCAVCHGQDGKGQYAFGAPNLTDDIWLYGTLNGRPASQESIMHTLIYGRAGVMPAFNEILNDDKIRIVAAYAWSLSQNDGRGMGAEAE
jgi:cytochrome c oxidase cbb3-type subunit 3